MSITSRTASWTREEFLAHPPIPFNRDFKRHSAQLFRAGVDRDNPVYKVGFMTVEYGGVTYGLNGNSRGELDRQGLVKLPNRVHGEAFTCANTDEAYGLYLKIDPPIIAKQAVDRMVSALNFRGIKPKSAMFLKGKGTSGVAIAWNALQGVSSNAAPKDTAKMVDDLLPEIVAVDDILDYCDVTSDRIATNSSLIAAMILTYAKTLHGIPKPREREIAANDWAEFWTAVHESKGRLRGTGTSPFNVLWEIIKDDSAGSGGKRDVLFKMVEKALDCFERREADRVFTVKKRPLASYHAVNSPPDFTDEEVVEVDGKPKTAKASASAAVDEYEFE